ncbi:superoxide dismutase family protein [Agriterribacter sp.]|uniref:superoxide dismutase family protein n=1 Tax=Agriterribacter sp. TaxID=2821509 RepID=UPI002CA8CB59|nr:superoxide dismutase family protein [Agriterribacter sp.]HTN09322.1 superoxide dismutase family protein [Agriterribacter sp.]
MNFYSISRRSLYLAALLPVLALVFSCNSPADNKPASDSAQVPESHSHSMNDTASVPLVKHAEAVLAGTYADTTVSGTAKFDADENGKVKLELEITIPAKAGKSVAVHIHEHGDCGDNGKMSHGHWNPTNQQHGKWGSAGFHSGDIGNVQLDAQGKGTLTLETDLWTLGGNAEKNILDKALIVHGGVDDYTTQPTGNAGSRIGCGVIK